MENGFGKAADRAAGGAGATAVSLVGRLGDGGMTAATAESCTGGLVAACITDVPGASRVFLGGIVSYDNRVKTGLLHVPPAVLGAHGAVSLETARAMADGARAATGADFAVSTTGIAGPGGATPGKPVGTVCIGVSGGSVETAAFRFQFPGDRAAVRRQAVEAAIRILLARVWDATSRAGACEGRPDVPRSPSPAP